VRTDRCLIKGGEKEGGSNVSFDIFDSLIVSSSKITESIDLFDTDIEVRKD